MKVPRSLRSILADSGLLISVSVGVQLIALLLLPWVSRLYTPDTLGDLALILSIATLLSIAVGGRYDQAIVVCQEPLERDHLLRLTLWITGVITLILFALTPVIEPRIVATRYATLQGQLWLIPPVVCALGLSTTLSNYALSLRTLQAYRHQQGGTGTRQQWTQSGLRTLPPTVWSLWGAQIASTLLALVPLLPSLKQHKTINGPTNRRGLKFVARKYRVFPIFSLPQTLITTLLGSILILMLPLGYTTVEVGLVSMATMLARRPIQLIADSVSQVYFNRLSVAHHAQAPWRPLVRPLLVVTLVVGIPTLLILWWAMPYLVRWLLAPEYVACTRGSYALCSCTCSSSSSPPSSTLSPTSSSDKGRTYSSNCSTSSCKLPSWCYSSTSCAHPSSRPFLHLLPSHRTLPYTLWGVAPLSLTPTRPAAPAW